ncbi:MULTISPECIES: URC4/urg3 family protein [Gordonia]|uniref:URC4/urg3 family protein n=1 Tax=Gordonia aquimaris TaxID=2984863 RepID=A0A9X3D3X8_9ACTN|nr:MULTISPECIES: URC4/urg3 family protein [Gordonia]MAU80385.1 uracil phosphoribosyltransferase [Gordonia sp. (in: high G+C Gram-positive bacteria)]MCX2964255.1 URC4/urg3 family protein [Gordonia aquimaris]
MSVDVSGRTGAGPTAPDTLRSTRAIRDRAAQLTERARRGESSWFTVDDAALAAAAALVARVTRRRYPALDIPFHSRWRHFEAGGVDRTAMLRARLDDDQAEQARALIDLAVVSVLLDAGAGPDWSFLESDTGMRVTRSEGLAVAGWHAFVGGVFSADPDQPLRVDATRLSELTVAGLAAAFQADETNPLVGVDGRVELLRRLGTALTAHPDVFGEHPRPGHLYDALVSSPRTDVDAHAILSLLLTTTSGIWLSDNVLDGVALGDCWRHDAVRGEGSSDGWMPFHKLSQWLTYSLLEPFEWSGHRVGGMAELTALPEYRNGGLLLDTGVISLRDPADAHRRRQVGDELVVEWRALTITLIDELASLVRLELDVDDTRLPLACVLEGGTWATGRELAGELRSGLPPLDIASDGTVF